MSFPAELEDSAHDFTPGSTFGRYKIVRCVGIGGMGSVYEGVHELLSRRVAIKVLHARLAKREDARERFLREARSVARIRHPHVVDIFDVGTIDDTPYLVMEYLEGEPLDSALARLGKMDERAATAVLLPLAAALSTVHRHGIIHRDVKPENVFLATDARGRVVPKLVDFGIAKDLSTQLAGANHTVVGTPHYMSPEQARGAGWLDARTDQYSFGVLAYELLTGRTPFDADSLLELVRAIDAGNALPLSEFVPSIDPRMELLVLRAMARDAEYRYASMRELGVELLEHASPRLANAFSAEFREEEAAVAVTEGVFVPTSLEAVERTQEDTLERLVRRPREDSRSVSGTQRVPIAPAAALASSRLPTANAKPWLFLAGGFGALLCGIVAWALFADSRHETTAQIPAPVVLEAPVVETTHPDPVQVGAAPITEPAVEAPVPAAEASTMHRRSNRVRSSATSGTQAPTEAPRIRLER